VTSTSEILGPSNERSQHRWRSISIGGLAAWLAGTIAVEVYGAIGRAAGVTLSAAAPGAQHAQNITPGSSALGVFICTFLGTALAIAVAKLTRRPAWTFVVAAIVLTAASLASPLGATHAAVSTKLFLACGHLMVAAIVIPILASQLPRHREWAWAKASRTRLTWSLPSR
jgi:Family of unknown function (DUF6069)